MQAVLGRQKSFFVETAETGDESATARVVCNIIYRMLCFVSTVVQRFMSYTLISHTNAGMIKGRSLDVMRVISPFLTIKLRLITLS